jgi:hypothetical protein
MNTKKIASHIVAVVVGLMLATCTRSPRVETQVVEVIKEVPVEVIKEVLVEKVVVKTVTEIEYRYVDPTFLIEIHDTLYRTYHIHNEHKLSIFAGIGPVGLRITPVSNGYRVKTKKDLVIGAGYSYNLDSKYSVGFVGLSNNTYLASLGVGF